MTTPKKKVPTPQTLVCPGLGPLEGTLGVDGHRLRVVHNRSLRIPSLRRLYGRKRRENHRLRRGNIAYAAATIIFAVVGPMALHHRPGRHLTPRDDGAREDQA